MLINDSTNTNHKRKQPPPDDAPTKSRRLLTLRELIPPKQIRKNSRALRAGDFIRPEFLPTIVDDDREPQQLNWNAVISRVRSHPREAAESYFVSSIRDGNTNRPAEIGAENYGAETTIMTYKPLHAMLKYDPPLAAVEAVLKAHPYAALDMTFEGTALKIAAENKVSAIPILRLLLVAEMAMRKKVLIDVRAKAQGKSDGDTSGEGEASSDSSSNVGNTFDLISVIPGPSSPSRMFIGHNPIRWISEPHIPRKTAALLLKWYPVGAFQRPRDDDGLPVEEIEQDYHDEDAMYSDSPLIEIVDDFASDQDAVEEGPENEVNDDSDDEEEDLEGEGEEHSLLPRRRRTFAEREYLRKERRWEKFLHVLYATDKILMSMKSTSTSEESPNSSAATVATVTADASTVAPSPSALSADPPPVTRFHPVHAMIRIITNPNLGMEICRPYGVWSILRAMGQRIPSEFTAKDEIDGNRTVFQILAESRASDCKLCMEEIRDVVECLMDADYKSAHLPRKSDGRLIVHVALENGWPCRDMFSRKTSATCA